MSVTSNSKGLDESQVHARSIVSSFGKDKASLWFHVDFPCFVIEHLRDHHIKFCSFLKRDMMERMKRTQTVPPFMDQTQANANAVQTEAAMRLHALVLANRDTAANTGKFLTPADIATLNVNQGRDSADKEEKLPSNKQDFRPSRTKIFTDENLHGRKSHDCLCSHILVENRGGYLKRFPRLSGGHSFSSSKISSL